MRVNDFIYDLPVEAIAQSAVEPRDSSRLLDCRNMSDHSFLDLPQLLDPGDLVVVNETRVRNARLGGRKRGSGGRVEVLVLGQSDGDGWEVLVRPARRIRVGTELEFGELNAVVVDGPIDGRAIVRFDVEQVDEVLERIGSVPLPPYFTGKLPDPSRYQTMFAARAGSAAAPTAGLHFTPRVIKGLHARGVALCKVELEVGVDTFRPMTERDVEDHRMHSEWCAVGEETASAIARTRQDGGRLVAVGTTTVRTLETFARSDRTVEAGDTRTDIFLYPGKRFSIADILVTNFHVPGSTLVAMVAGFMGPGWREAYRHALQSGYRFLSFGDAMLCERTG